MALFYKVCAVAVITLAYNNCSLNVLDDIITSSSKNRDYMMWYIGYYHSTTTGLVILSHITITM